MRAAPGTGASWYVLRRRVRGDWRALTAVVVLAGLGFGGSLGAVALARRTATAHDRFLPSVSSYDYSTGFGPDLAGEPMDAALSGVDGLSGYQQITGFILDVEGVDTSEVQFTWGWVDDVARLERPTVVSGRLPDASAVDEVVLNEEAARRSGLRSGDRVSTRLLTFRPPSFEVAPLPGVEQTLHVVGVVRLPDEYVLDAWRKAGIIMVSPAFVERYWEARAWGNAWMRMLPGASAGPLQEALLGVGLAFDEDRAVERTRVWQSVRPIVMLLGIIGSLAFAATWVLVVQSLLRRRQRLRGDDETIQALGGRRELRAAALTLHVALAAAIAMGATLVTVAMSPMAPLGPYHSADPGSDFFVDALVVVVGAAVIVATFVSVALVAGRERRRVPTTVSPLPLGGLPLPVRLGVGWAFDPRRAGSRSLLGATAGVAASMALIVAGVVFVGSLQELGRRPAWYGQVWDTVLRSPYGDLPADTIEERLGDDPAVAGLTYASLNAGSLDGESAPIIGLEAGPDARQWPLLVDGREPRRRGEVLVGEKLLSGSGLRVGDRATLEPALLDQGEREGGTPTADANEPEPWEVTIVGTAIFPNIGYRGVDPPRLGHGIAVDAEELRDHTTESATTIVLVELAQHASVDAFVRRHANLPGSFGVDFGADWLSDLRPVEVDQVTGTSLAIRLTVGALGLVAAAMLAHSLAATVDRRLRDYSLLRALGFTRRQLSSTVFVQALSVFALALLFAIAGGLALGRVVWITFANQLDVLARPTTDPVQLGAVALIGAATVALVVVPCARRARRVAAGAALHAE